MVKIPSPEGRLSGATVLAATAVVLLWASAYLGVNLALRDFTPGQLALARYLVASAVFLTLVMRRGVPLPRKRDLLRLAFAGAVGIALYNLALNWGQQSVNPGVASLLVNTVPIWTSLLAMLVLSERIPIRGWLGTGLAFLGVALIGLDRSGWSGFEAGVGLVLLAALAQAVYFIVAKPLLARLSPLALTAGAVWCGTLLLVPFGGGLPDALRASSSVGIASVLFLGVGPAALAYLAWAHVLAAMPAGRASNLLFLIPVVAIALGWLVLGDAPNAAVLIGGGLSIAGVFLSRRGQR